MPDADAVDVDAPLTPAELATARLRLCGELLALVYDQLAAQPGAAQAVLLCLLCTMRTHDVVGACLGAAPGPGEAP